MKRVFADTAVFAALVLANPAAAGPTGPSSGPPITLTGMQFRRDLTFPINTDTTTLPILPAT